MPFCPNCGKEVIGKGAFCFYCGELIPKIPPAQQTPVSIAEPSPKKEKPQEVLTKRAHFLFDLSWTTAQALVDVAGLKNALELIEPYIKSHSDASAQIMKDHFKIKTDDLFSMAVHSKFGTLLHGSDLKNFQFFDKGFTSDVSYCPFAYLSEALCQITEFYINYLVQSANTNYEYTHTKMLIKGDPYCQTMVKKKDHTIWGEIVKKPMEVPIPEISNKELEYWQSAVYSQLWIYMTNALVDFSGKEKAAEILRPYMKALGKTIAFNLSKELGIKDRDATSIALIINQCNQAMNQKGEYLIHTPDRMEKEITECIFASASQDICADALEARSNGICEAINPGYEFHLTKRMCKGDKVCHWIVKKK